MFVGLSQRNEQYFVERTPVFFLCLKACLQYLKMNTGLPEAVQLAPISLVILAG